MTSLIVFIACQPNSNKEAKLDIQETRKPNVLHILTDQWRTSAFAHSGDPNVIRPHIDAYAAQSVNFPNALSFTKHHKDKF